MSDAVTRLVLVRHGESRATLDQIVGGHEGCTGLSERGIRQAEALRDRLGRTGELRADVLLASLLPRAIETAEIIAPALGGLPVGRDCDVCELHPGESDGLTWAEFTERYRPDGWRFDPEVPMAPGAESVSQFRARVARTLDRLADDHRGQTVVVCTHGGVIDGSMIGLLEMPGHVWDGRFATENTSLTEWERRDGDGDGPSAWRLRRYNDGAHLAFADGRC
jgi:2,3-bisphosphoglycerate-dependent phosphoglycerate mutase